MTALDAFADTPRWVAWRSEERGPKGELTKIPYGPRGRKAKANDRLTWFDRRGEAQSLLALTVIDGTGSHNWLNGHGGGIGIQLGDLGDGRHLGGVDLDSCLDENGTSPSGHGIKALFTLDATHVRPFLDLIGVGVNQWGTKRGIKGLNGANHGPGIEIYLSHRFFAITERLFPGKPDRIAELDQPALENLAKLIPQPRQDDPKKQTGRDQSRSAAAFRIAQRFVANRKNFEEFCEAVSTYPDTAQWYLDKGVVNDMRELHRAWENAGQRRSAVESVLIEFNDKYSVVNESGKTFVVRWQRDPLLDREALEHISFHHFKQFYCNRWVKTGDDEKPQTVAKFWLSHPRRKTFDGITFDPTEKAPGSYFNLWRGFGVQRQRGSWAAMHDHICLVLCGGNNEQSDYLLNWTARMVQFPAKAGEVAVGLRTDEEGTGKGIFARWLVRIMGRHGLQIAHVGQLIGRFNDHLRDLVFLFADEAFISRDKGHDSILRSLITEYSMTTEAKYRSVMPVKNMLHLLLVTNATWAAPIALTDRRFFMPDVAATQRGNLQYFAALDKEMRNGGAEAMLDALLERDISEFEVRNIPDTEGRAQQKRLNLTSLEQWWANVLDRGFVYESRHGAPHLAQWHEFASYDLLHNSYLQWCDRTRSRSREPREALIYFLAKMYQRGRPRGRGAIGEIEQPHPKTEPLNFNKPDPDEFAIRWQERPRGFQVGDLTTARDRFHVVHPGALAPDDVAQNDDDDDDRSRGS